VVKFGFKRSKDSQPEENSEVSTPQRRRRSRKIGRQLSGARQLIGDRLEMVGDRVPMPLKKTRNLILLGGLLAAGVGLGYGYWKIEQELPAIDSLSAFVRPGTLTIKAADGTPILQNGPVTRDKVALKQMPKHVVDAFIAAEDRRFYQHNGVDYWGLLRAITKNVSSGEVVEGGSTLTQQLARMVFLNQDRSLIRKIREAMLAQKLERGVKKDDLLEKYLNMVYLGSEAYGVADAAWVFFGKSLNDLTLAESALLAGLPPAPSVYSPLVSPDVAKERRDIVLERMEEQALISASEAQKARSEPLNLKPSDPKNLQSSTPYFASYVQAELAKYVSKEVLEYGGLTVETTLNPKWQKAAEEAVKPVCGYNENEQAALVAVDPRNGEVRALVGGCYSDKSGNFNRATQAQRQPGSTFKPFVYAAGIASGFSPYRGYLDNQGFTVDGYSPKNYGGKASGATMDMRAALTKSVNVVAVKILIDVGFEPVIQLAKDAGIESPMKDTYSLALGAYEVNLLELTSSYGIFAAKGQHTPAHAITRIVDNKGKEIYKAKFEAKRALDEDSSVITGWMMESVVTNGTGAPAALSDRAVAGKTGTSENARDVWFIGYVPQMVAGIWVGNDDSSSTGMSSSSAAETWGRFMRVVAKDIPPEKFAELPKDLEERKGTIKAKPVKASVTSRGGGAESDRNEAPADSRSRRYEPEPEPVRNNNRDADREPAPARAEDIPPPVYNDPAPPPYVAPRQPDPEPAPVAPPPPVAAPPPSIPDPEPAPLPPVEPPSGSKKP
jgi:penicillin-binding protein 1A